jgi:hypothetical protein
LDIFGWWQWMLWLRAVSVGVVLLIPPAALRLGRQTRRVAMLASSPVDVSYDDAERLGDAKVDVSNDDVERLGDAKAARKVAKKAAKAAKRASRSDATRGRKECDVCSKSVDLLVRCRISSDGKWKMVCGTCWNTPDVAGGVTDGDGANPYYRYGGLWKNLHR